MGRRSGSTKKNQENEIIDLSLNDKLECENPSSKQNNVSTQVTAELANGASYQKETLENTISPRRSQRLNHNADPSSQLLQDYIQLVVEKVEPGTKNIGSEIREEDQNGFGEKNNPHKSTEEKIDHLFLLIKEQQKKLEAFMMSKEADKSCPSQNLSQAEIRLEMKMNKYKNMYVDSHKKIKNLEEEIYELTKKLECAHAKLEGYENGQHVFSGALEKLKDVLIQSSLSNTTETIAGHASPNLRPEAKTQAAKRKKGEASSQAGKRRLE